MRLQLRVAVPDVAPAARVEDCLTLEVIQMLILHAAIALLKCVVMYVAKIIMREAVTVVKEEIAAMVVIVIVTAIATATVIVEDVI